MSKYQVPLMGRKDTAVYKGKIAVQYEELKAGGSRCTIDFNYPIIEIEAKSEGLAYKKLCELFKPDDKRKIDGRGFLSLCEVGAKARIYKLCKQHNNERYIILDGEQDNGCGLCISEQNQIKYERNIRKYLIAEIASFLGCSQTEVGEEKFEVVKQGMYDFLECRMELLGKTKEDECVQKVVDALKCPFDDVRNFLDKLHMWLFKGGAENGESIN